MTLFSTSFAFLQLTYPRFPALTTASTSLLGTLAGFLSAIAVSSFPHSLTPSAVLTTPPPHPLCSSSSPPQALLAASSMLPCWEWEGHCVGVPTPTAAREVWLIKSCEECNNYYGLVNQFFSFIFRCLILFGLFIASYSAEWLTLPQRHFPGKGPLSR